MSPAALLATVSGGLQEETTYRGIPCLTVRDNTERLVTMTEGTNRICHPEMIGCLATEVLDGRPNVIDPVFGTAVWLGAILGRILDELS